MKLDDTILIVVAGIAALVFWRGSQESAATGSPSGGTDGTASVSPKPSGGWTPEPGPELIGTARSNTGAFSVAKAWLLLREPGTVWKASLEGLADGRARWYFSAPDGRLALFVYSPATGEVVKSSYNTGASGRKIGLP